MWISYFGVISHRLQHVDKFPSKTVGYLPSSEHLIGGRVRYQTIEVPYNISKKLNRIKFEIFPSRRRKAFILRSSAPYVSAPSCRSSALVHRITITIMTLSVGHLNIVFDTVISNYLAFIVEIHVGVLFPGHERT